MELKVIEKSRKLLIQVMGEDDFNKFVEDGKIEIVHDNKVYELDQNARVHNKTDNQSYCIEAICPDNLPLHDQLAIKYAYLKNNIKRVEEVANKRSLGRLTNVSGNILVTGSGNISVTRSGADYQAYTNYLTEQGYVRNPVQMDLQGQYSNFVDYMEEQGWSRQQVCITEHSNLVSLNDIYEITGPAVTITCPPGMKITVMGLGQVSQECDIRTAHALRVRFADSAESELSFTTRIRITKERASEEVIQLARLYYGDISIAKIREPDTCIQFKMDNEWYRFHNGVILNGGQKLRIYVFDPCVIDARNTRIALDADLWTQ